MVPQRTVFLFTSTHLRHRFFAQTIARVVRIAGIVAESKPGNIGVPEKSHTITNYLDERSSAESRFFGKAPALRDCAEMLYEVPWQDANTEELARRVRETRPDVVVLFGSSIIRDPLLSEYEGRILNMHLGLSPYYRGSATNFWPLVDGKPECVGATIHHATSRVDGGDIVGQVRPTMHAGIVDSHAIGCESVMAGAELFRRILTTPGPLPAYRQEAKGKLCRRSDFNEAAVTRLRQNLKDGMLAQYRHEKGARDARYPIIEFE